MSSLAQHLTQVKVLVKVSVPPKPGQATFSFLTRTGPHSLVLGVLGVPAAAGPALHRPGVVLEVSGTNGSSRERSF